MTPLLLIALAGVQPPRPAAPPRPKLVVMLTVDQLRSDYLVRYRSQLTGGLALLLSQGAVYTAAYQDHGVTETAPGHSTVLSGRWPAHTGILTNTLGVGDSSAPLLEVTGTGASPRRFRGTALYDWMRAADTASRALSVSRKDRGAILPIGTARAQVYWYQAGLFTSSTYYMDSLPPWVRTFNAQRLPFKAAGRQFTLLLKDSAYAEPDSVPWENGGHDVSFPHNLPADSVQAARAVVATPLMDSLTLAFALTGCEALKLGRRGPTDLLAVSLSATDYVGHAFGPDSREIHDQVLRLDRALGWFLERLFDRVGRGNVVIVLTADHGVTPFPAASVKAGRAARTVSVDTVITAVNARLDTILGGAARRRWFDFDPGILFQRDNGRMAAAGVNVDSVVQSIARRLRAVPGVARVDRPADLVGADTAGDATARRWVHDLAPGSDIALVVTLEEWNAWGAPPPADQIAMHGQPSELDSHVPLIFWGRDIPAGSHPGRANTVDIAPTLARLLGLAPLSVPDGRVLSEVLAR